MHTAAQSATGTGRTTAPLLSDNQGGHADEQGEPPTHPSSLSLTTHTLHTSMHAGKKKAPPTANTIGPCAVCVCGSMQQGRTQLSWRMTVEVRCKRHWDLSSILFAIFQTRCAMLMSAAGPQAWLLLTQHQECVIIINLRRRANHAQSNQDAGTMSLGNVHRSETPVVAAGTMGICAT